MDGTLLTHAGEIAKADIEALEQVRAAGVVVTIITGRLYSGTKALAHRIGALGPVACIDGSQIVDSRTDEPLVHHSLSGDKAERLREAVAHDQSACFLFANDEIGHDGRGHPYLSYVKLWSSQLRSHDDVRDHPHWDHPAGISEVVCVGEQQVIRSTVERIQENLAEQVDVVSFPIRGSSSNVWGLVARAAGTTKGTAVEWLARHYGCSTNEVAVVGDWLNDVPMFEKAGRSFAMGQAPDAVKRAATDILESTARAGGGIAEAARKAGIVR